MACCSFTFYLIFTLSLRLLYSLENFCARWRRETYSYYQSEAYFREPPLTTLFSYRRATLVVVQTDMCNEVRDAKSIYSCIIQRNR
jgi:hypothetical protein